MNNVRRRKKRHTHGTKTVDVSRGKTGYGFTISGQQPCILSCIVAGSPADRAGLKTGDYLLSVNNLNVSKASHDEVVRLIGSSSGTLTLVIAENDNDSDSSDDCLQARPKNKYPNRVRLRQQQQGRGDKDGAGGFGRERSENVRGRSSGNIQHNKKQVPQLRSRALSPVVERYGRDGSRGVRHGPVEQAPQEPVWFQHQQPTTAPLGRGVENMDPLSVAVYPRRQKHASAGAPQLRPPQGTKHTIITREMRMVKSQSHPESLSAKVHAPHPREMQQAVSHQPQSSMTTKDLSNILYPSIQPHINQAVPEKVDHGPCGSGTLPNIRIIVGYVGSVEMPRDSHMPCSRQQSIRSAVRRLRVDHRVHTLVLMEIYFGGIRMTNTLGSIVALYAAERIAFSGTCPDDKRFFGIVTVHRDDVEGLSGPVEDVFAGSSCHVFMVDPDMAIHSVHVQKAKSFGIQCTIDPIRKLCQEFPQLASGAVKHISTLCRNRNSSVNDGEIEAPNEIAQPLQHGPRNSESNSSNSDSGLGFGREDPAANSDQVYVVEMPNASIAAAHNVSSSTQDSSLNWTAERSAFHPADGSMYKSTGESDLSTMIPPSLRYQSGTSEPSMSSNVNTSMSSNDASFLSHGQGSSTFDRLNLRVMPDPRGVTLRAAPADVLETQNSADNLRRSMHRYMQSQAQQRYLDQSGSDVDSLRSNESTNSNSGNARPTGKGTRSQGVTAIDPSDPHKLSPRVFQPPGPASHPTPSGTPYEFLVPAVPVLSKPPVPDRRPALPPKAGFRTPMRERPLPERPKSTPPFRGNMVTPPPLATDEEYDSDPGSVMGSMLGGEEEWNGQIMDPEQDDDDDDDEQDAKPPKEKRRFSEGFFTKKVRVKGKLGEWEREWSLTLGKQDALTTTDRRDEESSEEDERDKENVENSRLAKGGSFKQIKIKKRPTLSTSHESLVVNDGVDFPTKKLNGAPSATSILHPSTTHPAQNGGPAQHGQRSARWAIGFDRLLEDGAGLATFTEFLKKEFSQENIDFWVKCENYKQVTDEEERQAEARRLWEQHLSLQSSESVNVDGPTLTGVEQGLEMAPPTLFDEAQSHIFRLMKQDSYPRFLKSELYKTCVVAEMEGRPLPYPGPGEDQPRSRDEKKVTFGEVEFQPITKSKSTVSMDKGKRRQSFFPFTWNKSKSEKRLVKAGDVEGQQWAMKKDEGTVRVGVGSLDLVDLSVMSREIRAPSSQEDDVKDENSNNGNKEVKLCRVILPDGSTTVLHANSGTPIRSTLQHLCQRRTLCLPALEVFQHGSDKALDLTKDASTLASKEIRVEQRVLFQADLPTRRPLVVRARPATSLREALKPILPKYNCKVDNMVAHQVGSDSAVDLDASVSNVEGQRLLIQTEEDFAGKKRRFKDDKWRLLGGLLSPRITWTVGDFDRLRHTRKEWGGFGSHRGKPPIPSRSKSSASLDSAGDDDDLVRDVIDGKLDVAHLFDEHGVFDPDKKHDKRGEDGRSSGIFGFIRRNSVGEKDAAKYRNKNGSVSRGSSQPGSVSSGHDPDKPRPRPRPPVRNREAENLFEQLNKLSGRLDDQRGDRGCLSKADLELPDFLKLDKGRDSKTSGEYETGSPRTIERRNSDSSILDAETSRRLSQSVSQENVNGTSSGIPGSPHKIPYMDQSFSQDGIMPTNTQAEQAFSTARQYPGSPDLNRTWQSTTSSEPVTTRDSHSQRVVKRATRAQRPHSPIRRAYSPRSRTPDPKRTLLHEVNGLYSPRRANQDVDLSVRALPSSGEVMQDPALVHMEINDYVPPPIPPHGEKPTPRARKPAPLPPPRKTLTTPKKFLPPPTPTGPNQAQGARHSQQNSTSSELSHHSSGTSGSSGTGASPSSTPSPSTHDLLAESSPDSGDHTGSTPRRTRPQPPPRPSRRGHGTSSSGGSSADESGRSAQKSLNFEQKDSARQKQEGSDMQVSYV